MKLMGKMVCYFLIVVVVGAVGFGLIINDSSGTKADIGSVYTEELPRMLMVAEIMENSLEQAVNVRGYLITRNEQMVDNYRKAVESNKAIEKDLLAQARTADRRRLIEEVIAADNKYSDYIDKQVLPLARAGNMEAATSSVVGAAQYFDQLIDAVDALEKEYIGVTNQSLVFAINSADATIRISIIAALASIIIGMGVAVWTAKGIAGKVGNLAELAHDVSEGDLTEIYTGSIDKDEVGDLATSLNTMVRSLKEIVTSIGSQSQSVAASSEELTASADQAAQATQHIAGSLAEVAAATDKQLDSVKTANGVVENMVAELQEIAANVNMVADKAVETADMAANGGKSATKAINQMHEVEKTVSNSAKVVEELGERSKEIGQIVDTIAGIAGQTNLLALNAAIEAARAGEQGRGFAVVAEEVRKLAEQSQEASKRIAELIGEIQVETTRAVAAMENGTREVKIGAEVVNETGVSFQEIIGLVNQVSEQMNGISKVVQHVAHDSEKIVESVHYIRELSNAASGEIETVSAATEEQSASMQEIAAASQNLSKLAMDMQVTVERFRI